MNNDKIVNYINKKTKLTDKRYYMSLLYLAKYLEKDRMLLFCKEALNYNSRDWLLHLDKETNNCLSSKKCLDIYLEGKFMIFEKLFGKEYVKMVKEHYDNIGLFEVLKDKDIDNFISLIDKSKFSIKDIYDIYMQIITPNRYKNDFFTPLDICDLMAKIVGNDATKTKISIGDPTCGIGNLLYAKFKNMIMDNPNLDIEVFGNDRDRCYASFANSIFHLFHNKSYFENKNALTENIFYGQSIDIIVGNPPFGAMCESDYKFIKNQMKIA